MVRAHHADEDIFESLRTGSQLGHGARFHQLAVVNDGHYFSVNQSVGTALTTDVVAKGGLLTRVRASEPAPRFTAGGLE